MNPPKRPIQTIPMTPLQKRMHEDLQWAAQAPEVHQHHGKYVIIKDKRVIAIGHDCPALLEQAARQEQCSPGEFVVEVVPDPLWEQGVDFADFSEHPFG
jgi:hypothetical protein